LATLFAAFAISASAAVQICDGAGNCYTFDGPGCSEWGLASGSTCSELDIAFSIPLASHPYKNGKLSIEYKTAGQIIAVNSDRRGNSGSSVTLLDLGEMSRGNYVGVAAKINNIKVKKPADKAAGSVGNRTILDVQVLRIDRRTKLPLERRIWSFDITDSMLITPVVIGSAIVGCPQGTYPPNCYPCLGCKPCNDGSGDYCDTVGSAIAVSNLHPNAHSAGYDLKDGRLVHKQPVKPVKRQ
jgi:hypothetical protein